MTPERWKKIKALFSSAQDVSAEERDGFLVRACGGDEQLRMEVEKLLDSDNKDDSFLQDSAVAEATSLFDGEDMSGHSPDEETQPSRFESGIVLNERYEIVRLLGRGGMGEVYLATDRRINRNVALKVLHPDLVSSKESLRRFALEAQAVSALNHPHIMTIYEFDNTDDGTLFFVAEFVDGQTLNHLIGRGLGIQKTLDIAIQVSSALSAAHEAGMVHRDIKPENIMVRRDGYVKVLDFGLAKLTQDPRPHSPSAAPEDPTQALARTKPGAVMGTAAYMSPEQARGLRVDARTDIWSLGAVIYEMLTGHRPFPGATSADIIVSVLLREPQPISTYVRDLPAELDWMVSKALSKDVEGRYQTAKELRSDLDRIRKKVDFDESLSRSSGSVVAAAANAELEIESTVEQGVATAGDAARPTSGAQTGPVPARFYLSSSSVQAVFRQAQTHKLGSVVIAVLLVALLSAVAYFGFIASRSGEEIDSIAVLPFVNLTGNPDLDYASDGLSEALIDRLSQLPQLKVISRNSSFRFRGADVDLRDAASQLGVRAVVTGSMGQVGDELTIRFDIVDAVDDKHLTGGQYRRKPGDLIRIQNEIAQAAADRLRLKLTKSQAARLADPSTDNSEAYRYYLSGLVEISGPLFVQSRALEYFEKATELDPNFAAAYAEIAWVYYSRANSSSDPGETMDKARQAAERALTIDPNLPKGHVVQAMMYEYDFDWIAAEREYKQAIELSPNLDFARNNYGFFLSVMGRQSEALSELEEQRIRDPLNLRLILLHKAIVLVQARRFDDALAAYREAQSMDPTRNVPNSALGYAYAGKGLYNEAAGYYKKSVELLGGEDKYSQSLVYLAATYARMPEKRSEARAILTRIEATSRYASPALLAVVYAALNENDRAIELLETAYIRHDPLLRFIGTGYEYDGLRQDPRFNDLVKRIGLSTN